MAHYNNTIFKTNYNYNTNKKEIIKRLDSSVDTASIVCEGGKRCFSKDLGPGRLCPDNPSEIDIQSRVEHSNILKVDWIVQRQSTEQGTTIKMRELDTNLFDYIMHATVKYSVDHKLNILYKILDTLNSLHQENIIHLDLKPENVMMDKDEPYIIDFGSARSTGDCYRECFLMKPISNEKQMTGEIRPPEIYKTTSRYTCYGWYCDVWSLVYMIVFTLVKYRIYPKEVKTQGQIHKYLEGKFSYPDERKSVIENLFKGFSYEHIDELKRLLLSMLNYKYDERPTVCSILSSFIWDPYRRQTVLNMVIHPKIVNMYKNAVGDARSIYEYFIKKYEMPIQPLFMSIDLYYRSSHMIDLYSEDDHATRSIYIRAGCCIISLASTISAGDDEYSRVLTYYHISDRAYMGRIIDRIIIYNKGALNINSLYAAARSLDHLKYMIKTYFFDPIKYTNFDYDVERCNDNFSVEWKLSSMRYLH